MLEEQLERVRGETKGVGEAVGRAREVVETLGKEGQNGTHQDLGTNKMRGAVVQQSTKEQRMEKRTWEVLEREVGRI